MFTANTAPPPNGPPYGVVPYKTVSDKTNLPWGPAPSGLTNKALICPGKNVCKYLNPVPSVLIAKTAPLNHGPPKSAVPYNTSPELISLATGEPASIILVKLCRVVNSVPSRLI